MADKANGVSPMNRHEVNDFCGAAMAAKSPMTADLIYLLAQLSPIGFDQRTVDDAIFHIRTLWQRAEAAEQRVREQGVALADAIARLVDINGGTYRGAARSLGVDVGYLHRLRNEAKENPTDEMLARLGLRRSVRYAVIADEKWHKTAGTGSGSAGE